MSILATLTALLHAATAALKVFPLWLAWRQWDEIENLSDGIIQIEARAQPSDRPRLERMRVKLSNARKHHAALLAVVAASQSGPTRPDDSRDIRSPGG